MKFLVVGSMARGNKPLAVGKALSLSLTLARFSSSAKKKENHYLNIDIHQKLTRKVFVGIVSSMYPCTLALHDCQIEEVMSEERLD